MASSTSLTDDILIEIFTSLPLNSICKFKCLAKVWLANLSSPNFINHWCKLNNSLLPWIFVHAVVDNDNNNPLRRNFTISYPESHSRFISQYHSALSLSFLNQIFPNNSNNQERKYLHLIGSSSGLVLLRRTNMHNQITRYHVCNLLTQKWVLLPPPPPRRQKNQPVTGFICNGCFSESTSFKVIRIPKFEGTTKRFKVEMFSSELGEWKTYRVSCSRGVTWGFPCYDNLITLKGVLYWFQKENGKILAVSVNGNTNHRTGGCECRLIKLPDRAVDVENKYTSQCLGESQGLICYAIAKYKKRSLSVWVLEEDWCLLHKDIQFYDMLAQMEFLLNGEVSMVDLSRDIQVLGFNPDDKNVVIFGFEKYIWAYNIRTKGYEQLLHPSFLSSNFTSPHARILTFALKLWPTVLPPISRERKSAQLETTSEGIEIGGGCSSATEE